jgi:hypothetical protein
MRSYNTGNALGYAAQEPMDKFEEFGRRLDEELARLRKYVEEEVAPETEKRTAHEASKKLEARAAARVQKNSQEPKP